jgi:beta-glucanase (GH16 family)
MSASFSARSLFSSRINTVAVLGLLWMASCTVAAAQTWGNPVWSDEFDGLANSAPSSANWTYDTGILNVNNEAEYYCASGNNTPPCVAATPNAYLDGNGHLVIQAIKISSSQAPYSASWTSARLKSQGLQNFQYGRLESSMSLPIGPGIWPAYWALGNNIGTVGWPTSGEIDFMENVPASSGLGPTKVQSTIHGGASSSSCYCGGHGLGQPYTFPASDPNGTDVTTFHTYGAIWSPNMVQFYVDDPTKIFFVVTANDIPAGQPWDFNHPFFLLLNLAVGGTGSWPGPPDGTTPNPALMTVDYVRWYQASATAGPTMTAPAIAMTRGSGSTTVSLSSTSGTGRVFLSCSTTAPNAVCSVKSADALNPYTVDFSNAATATATVSVGPAAAPAASPKTKEPGQSSSMLRSSLPGPLAATAPALTGFAFGGLLLGSLVLVPEGWNRGARRAIGGTALTLALVMHPACGSGNSGTGGGGGNGYSVTVSTYTVSSAGNPDSTLNIAVTGN